MPATIHPFGWSPPPRLHACLTCLSSPHSNGVPCQTPHLTFEPFDCPNQHAQAAGPLLVYVRPEDEFLHAQSTASFTWRVEGRPVAKDELAPMRLALLFTSEAAARARKELDRVVGNAAGMAPPPPMAVGAGAKGKGKAKAGHK